MLLRLLRLFPNMELLLPRCEDDLDECARGLLCLPAHGGP